MTPREIIGRSLGGPTYDLPSWRLPGVEMWNKNYFDKYADDILAALSAAGFVIVPRMPTDGMNWAGRECLVDDAPPIYRAMIAAWERSNG